jgi:cell wall assembly regulator SMI1
MGNGVAATWAAIEAWAADERPELVENLRGPVAPGDLAALQATGLPIPQSLLDSLAVHDGEEDSDAGFFPQGGRWLPVAEMLSVRDMLREALEDADDRYDASQPTLGPLRPAMFSEARLPIIDMNGDVTWHLDFDPAPGGTVGQVIRLDIEGGEFVVCAPDFATFLAMYREDLEAGLVNGSTDEGDDDEGDEDEEDDGPWPPYSRLPALQPGKFGDAELKALGEMGRWNVALALIDSLPPAPGLRTRLEARVAQQQADYKKAAKLFEQLASDGHETEDDLLARLECLEWAGRNAQALALAETTLAARPFAALHVRHAKLVMEMAGEAPVKGGRKAQMEWFASPAGQQATAIAREKAIAGYDAALALDDRLEWRFERVELLMENERWEDAEAEAAALVARTEADEAVSEDDKDEARDLLQQAQARGEGGNEDMLGSLDEMLAGFQQLLGGKDSAPLAELAELRDAFAGLMDQEAAERAVLDADPDSTPRRAREVAAQIARLHADTPERFAPFDHGELGSKALRWYDRARDALLEDGFEHVADVEPVRNTEINGKRVMMRLMLSADRRTAAAIWRLEGPMMAMEVVDLESELEDGRIFMSSNNGSANPFEQPEPMFAMSLPLGTPVRELLKAHVARLDGQMARPIPDLEAMVALQERQRIIKRDAARARGWASDAELRGLLGGSYRELAGAVRAELVKMLGGDDASAAA